MVQTIKFSQFSDINLSNSTNLLVGVSSSSGGDNIKSAFITTWTTATRPGTPYNGLMGYNTDLTAFEFWNGSAWTQLTSGSPSIFLQKANNLSDVASASTSRTNLGLAIGVNVQAWSTILDSISSNVMPSSVQFAIGSFNSGSGASSSTFWRGDGTWAAGGIGVGTVTSVATAGLATGGPITTSGTITVTAASIADQNTGTSNSVVVTPGVQIFNYAHPKAFGYITNNGSTAAVSQGYGITSATRNSQGVVTLVFVKSDINIAPFLVVTPTGGTTPAYATQTFINGNTTTVYTFDSAGAPFDTAFVVAAWMQANS